MFDPRLYILGSLALLSLVSVAYLVAAAIGHLRRVARARRAASSRLVSDEQVGLSLEPVVPAGPPPILEADPFGGAASVASQSLDGEGGDAGEAELPESPPGSREPGMAESVTLPPVVLPAPAAPEPAVAPAPSAEADQTARIAALLASLEQQAESEAAASPAPASVPEPEPAVEPAPLTAGQVAEYRLVAPVELHFTDGSGRVGVRPGTRTHEEFQRLANALLDELKRARSDIGQ